MTEKQQELLNDLVKFGHLMRTDINGVNTNLVFAHQGMQFTVYFINGHFDNIINTTVF